MLGSHFIPPEDAARNRSSSLCGFYWRPRPNEDSSGLLGRARGARVPERLELGLRDIAREHHEREPREPKPPGPRVGRHELMRDQAVVPNSELALHPAVLVDLRV